jgi:transcriptional regulator with XRE-family HTH domain
VNGKRLVAENLRTLRRRVGLSQEALADRAQVHRTYVGAIERAHRNISIELICRLAWALSVHPRDLLGPTSTDTT